MSEPCLTLLAISDLHYTGLARQSAQQAPCRGELSRSLLKKVFLRLSHMGVKPDIAVLLGDMTEDGSDANARADLISLHGELTRCGIPYLALPGNHDIPSEAFNARLGTPPGLYSYGGYGLVVMNDTFSDSHECVRSPESFSMLKKIREENPELPLIALQHAPIYPSIDSNYPYRPSNVGEIIDSYEKAGVLLSLSGHYHEGQKARVHNDVLYHTVSALCEPPFCFSVIRLSGKKIEIEEQTLSLQLPNIVDVHCHTEHAYCGTTIDTAPAIALSEAMGVQTLCLTEHAFQLYFNKHDAMHFEWQSHPEMVERVWATPERYRMAAFRRFAEQLRSPFVKIGLEVDLYGDGELLIAPEDEEAGWDILVGAIHKVRGVEAGKTSQAKAEELFLRDVEQLVGHNIQVLAHAFRFFPRHGLERPVHLYPVLASLLADNNVALEVNFHTYHPAPEFIKMCVDKGVKIALASDSHDLAEVGEFWPHVNILRQAGVTPKSFGELLYTLKEPNVL